VGDRLANDESYFNNQLTKIHIKSEHCFGIIMARFQAFNEFVFWSKMAMVPHLDGPVGWLFQQLFGSYHQKMVQQMSHRTVLRKYN